MPDLVLASYEAVPYDSHPIGTADIESMETMALLHGLSPVSSEDCRVLELGCASGGNLLPMAARFPSSRFVGVDLAPGHVAEGHRAVAALGLDNVEMHAMSIADIDESFGTFDYVICHGVYSWVPPEVKDAILRVCSRNLSSSGLAYISYNTLPGWHARSMLREMMLFHDDPSLAPAARIARARAFAESLVADLAEPHPPHAAQLIGDVAFLRQLTDTYLLHEYLEPFNQPVYFFEFVREAMRHGLRFVSESAPETWSDVDQEWVNRLVGSETEDVTRAEQYVDFRTGRLFRRSLLCHAALEPAAGLVASVVPELYVRSQMTKPTAAQAAAGSDPATATFSSPDGLGVSTNNPLLIAALRAVDAVKPVALRFDQLVAATLNELRERRDVDRELIDHAGPMLAEAMLQCASAGLVGLHRRAPTLTATVSERPRTNLITRFEARNKKGVTNAYHRYTPVNTLDRLLLSHLDGTVSREQLLEIVRRALADGSLTYKGPSESSPPSSELLSGALERYAKSALLVA